MAALAKHAAIFQSLHKAILRGDYLPGERLPSEVALGRRFRASRPTIAHALRELQRLELVERHVGAGSFARLPAAKAGSFGLIADGLGATEIVDPISVELARAAQAAGYNLLVGSTSADRDPEETARTWHERGVAGIFFAPIEHHPVRAALNRAIADRLVARGVAVVLLDRDVGEFPDRSTHDLVAIDDFFAGFDLAAHILGRGRRKLAFVAQPHFPATTDLRLAGSRAAVLRAEESTLAFCVGDPTDAKWVQTALGQTGADAVICANDATAAGLMQSLARLERRVPGETMVAGFDDVRYAKLLTPPLTTMRQPCAALGAAAVEAMISRLRHPHAPARRILLRAELVVRASTAD